MRKTILFLLLFITFSSVVKAQMFSVGEDSRRTTNPFAPYIRIGVKSIDFNYKGNQEFITPVAPFEFSGHAYSAAFESYGFNLEVSLANILSGLDTHNYLDLGISFQNPFYLVRQQNLLIGVPIRLSSQLISVKTNETDEFSQTNLSAGAGAVVQLHFPEILGSSLQIIPNYGFSSASGGFVGGSAFTLIGKARINIYNLIFNKHLSIGYDYNFTSYDIDEDQYDYDFMSHSLTLGVSF